MGVGEASKHSGHLLLPVGRRIALTRAGVTSAVGLLSPAIMVSLLLEAHILGSRGTLLRRNLTGRSAGGLAAVGSVALPGVVVPLRFLIRVTARSRLRRAFSRLCRTTTDFSDFRVPVIPCSSQVRSDQIHHSPCEHPLVIRP